jgi:hypothetical protein
VAAKDYQKLWKQASEVARAEKLEKERLREALWYIVGVVEYRLDAFQNPTHRRVESIFPGMSEKCSLNGFQCIADKLLEMFPDLPTSFLRARSQCKAVLEQQRDQQIDNEPDDIIEEEDCDELDEFNESECFQINDLILGCGCIPPAEEGLA